MTTFLPVNVTVSFLFVMRDHDLVMWKVSSGDFISPFLMYLTFIKEKKPHTSVSLCVYML